MTKKNTRDEIVRRAFPDSTQTVSRFNAFIEEAKAILSDPDFHLKSNPATRHVQGAITEFELFVAQAKPIIVRDIRDTLQAHRKALEALYRCVVPRPCDVLTAAGLSGNEDFYTNLIKWMLWPEGRPDVALRCQRAWLNALDLDDVAAKMGKAVEPKVQFITADGRPDMVLHFHQPDFLLIVEAKVGSTEHDQQTIAYPEQVLQALDLPKDHPCEMVFLTPDGREADNVSAIRTTYEELAMVIAESLSPDTISPDLHFAYSNVITHFLTHVTSDGTDKAGIIWQLRECLQAEPRDLSEDQIMKELSRLGPLCQTLSVGKSK